VAGLTLALRGRPAGHLPAPYQPFLARRGADLRLDLTEASPPAPTGELLFDSGSVWRVHRHGRGLLYTFRAAGLDPSTYKAVAIDRALTRGRLYFPPQRRGRPPGHALAYPLDELLFQHRLAREGGLEVHACGLRVHGRLLLFCGPSGAGKSTTARLWRRALPRVRILSDDRIVLRRREGRVTGWGTPWHGAGGFAWPGAGRLGALFFLRQSRTSRARPLSSTACAARLFARSFPPPWDAPGVRRALATCAAIAAEVPGFELAFRPDASAVTVALEAMERPGRGGGRIDALRCAGAADPAR
jgi:hypothetical protein